MELFTLPQSTKVQRVIPKNAFDTYTNSKQKKIFSESILRITWLYKLSPETVNLDGVDIKEIQIFKIELKAKDKIKLLLEIINKAIPYHIIFIIIFENEAYISTSPKHTHPTNENKSVIDWTFATDWFLASESNFSLTLKKNLDFVYQDFCNQISGKSSEINEPLRDLIEYNKIKQALERDIERLKNQIKSSKQFKNKVALNIELQEKSKALLEMIESYRI